MPSPELIEGYGARGNVGRICREAGYGSVLLITDKTISSLGLHEAVVASLAEHSVPCTVFSGIESEPDTRIVSEAINLAMECRADCIVALGGGSVMDTSKIVASGVKLHISNAELLLPKFLLVPGGSLPLITIPSTAGTGAELTVGAVISSSRTHSKCATVVVGLNIKTVVLDSSLSEDAPAGLTAACAIDALSHGLEGCLSDVKVSREDMCRSRECVRLVFENLPVVLADPHNRQARKEMCLAAHYGGNAINRQLAGYVHAVAHTIGSTYHIPHGVAIAMALLPVLEHDMALYSGKLAPLARHCGFAGSGMSDTEAAGIFMQRLEDLIRKSGLNLDGSMLSAKDFPRMTRLIRKDSINYSPERILSAGDIEEILTTIQKRK